MNKLGYLLLLPWIAAGARDGGMTTRDGVGDDRAVDDGAAAPATLAFSMPATDVRPARRASLRPVRWSLVGGKDPRVVAIGRTVPITVQADIAKGWHIYSLNQKPGGPIPLRIGLTGADGVTIRGVVKAPKPERAFDKNFGIETELYSGSPRFTIPVGVSGRSAAGRRKVQVAARYQVCSDKLCLPPRTDSVGVTLRVTTR